MYVSCGPSGYCTSVRVGRYRFLTPARQILRWFLTDPSLASLVSTLGAVGESKHSGNLEVLSCSLSTARPQTPTLHYCTTLSPKPRNPAYIGSRGSNLQSMTRSWRPKLRYARKQTGALAHTHTLTDTCTHMHIHTYIYICILYNSSKASDNNNPSNHNNNNNNKSSNDNNKKNDSKNMNHNTTVAVYS